MEWSIELLFLRSNSLKASLVNQIFDSPSQNNDGFGREKDNRASAFWHMANVHLYAGVCVNDHVVFAWT